MMLQWRSNPVNHQIGIALPVLDPKLNGYEISELYQWEVCVQLTACDAMNNTPVNEIGNKFNHLILQLKETHGNNKCTVYSKKEKHIKVTTFPKEAQKTKESLQYDIKDRQNRNVLLLLHVISVIWFHMFKGTIFSWLSQNQVFLTKTTLCSTKELIKCLEHLMSMNPL
eukprot:372477-Ditylum_brightwellii.AAC.1